MVNGVGKTVSEKIDQGQGWVLGNIFLLRIGLTKMKQLIQGRDPEAHTIIEYRFFTNN